MAKRRTKKKPPVKRRKKRDYKAEYNRRIELGKELGYSYSQSRGHPRKKKGELPIRLARILKITPTTPVELRPRQLTPPGYPSFEERLIRAGFKDWVVEQRKVVLKRETELPDKRIARIAVSQGQFLNAIMESGHTEREAYTQWFSPK